MIHELTVEWAREKRFIACFKTGHNYQKKLIFTDLIPPVEDDDQLHALGMICVLLPLFPLRSDFL